MVGLAYDLKKALNNNDLDSFGTILHEGWLLKKSLVKEISNSRVDEIYEKGLKAGADGGKLLGAGAGGFILFYCKKEEQEKFKKNMAEYRELPFDFDQDGSKIIYVGEHDKDYRKINKKGASMTLIQRDLYDNCPHERECVKLNKKTPFTCYYPPFYVTMGCEVKDEYKKEVRKQ